MSRARKITDDGSFKTKGKNADTVIEETQKDLTGVSFDAHYVTLKLIEYGKLLTGIPLYRYQYAMAYRIIYSVISLEGSVITMLLARQSGKSETLAFVVNTLSTILPALARVIPDLEQFQDGIKIGLFAPQSDQVYTTYNRALMRLTTENAELVMGDPDLQVGLEKPSKYNLSNGSYMMGQVASKQSKIESKTYDLVLIEEAQDVDSYIVQKSIEPMVSACVCAGTLVWNNKGELVPIESLSKEDGIIGYNGKTFSKETITYWQEPTNKDCYKITTNTGRYLECSYDHPILYRERKGGMYGRKMYFKEASAIKEGEQIAVLDSLPIWGNSEMWEPRLVGWLIGDGTYGKDHSPRLANCDYELTNYVETNFTTKVEKTYETKKGKEFKEIVIKGICKNLKALGIYGQTKNLKRLPDNIGQYSKKSLAELLGGLFDTDGYCTIQHNRRGKIGLTSMCYELLVQVKFELQKFGIHANIYTKKPTKTSFGNNIYYDLSFSDKRSLEAFNQINFVIKYKQDAYKNLLTLLKEHKEKIPKEVQGLRLERVVSVENIGAKPVYNLTAGTTNTYCANGIVTHNTGGTIVKCGTTGTSKSDFWYEINYNRNKSRALKDERLHLHWEFNYKKIFEDKRYQHDIDKKLFHLNYEKDVSKKMDKWGRESQAFKLSYALEWDLESGMLLTDKDFEKILNRKKGLGNFDEDDLMIAGLDLGKDIASTVLTIGKIVFDPNDEGSPPKKEIVAWVELQQMDYEQQHHVIVEYLQMFNVQNIFVDYTGVGKPFVDRLNAAIGEYVNITPYSFSTQSKSDMWFNLLDHVNTGRLIVPANKAARSTTEWARFQEQLLNCQKWYNGAYLCAQKSDGYLDDFVDSLGLMLLADNFTETFEVEEEAYNPFYDNIADSREALKRNSY